MTNIVQPIDAGTGCSLRCAIGKALDERLLVNENLRKWESKMTASERRILITWWLAKGMNFVMDEEQATMRVGCFERTGCLITFLVSDEHDKKIRPQGIEPGSFDVPIDGSLLGDVEVSYQHLLMLLLLLLL